MHVVARVLAVAYVILGIFGTIVYAQTTLNYVNVAGTTVNLEDRVNVSHVDLAWSGDVSDSAVATVWVNVTNPGNVAVEILSFSFRFHMDDPSDGRLWFDPEKLEDTRIRSGGFAYGKGYGFVLQPGETRSMPSVVPIEAGTAQMDRFARPDAEGRYHPIVWEPSIVYTFVEFNIVVQVFMPPFYDAQGVVPSG